MILIVTDTGTGTFIAVRDLSGQLQEVKEPGEYECTGFLRIIGRGIRVDGFSQDNPFLLNDLSDMAREKVEGTFGLNGYRIVDPDDTYQWQGRDLMNITRNRAVRKYDGRPRDMFTGRTYQGNGVYT